jgi:hypothetical protein
MVSPVSEFLQLIGGQLYTEEYVCLSVPLLGVTGLERAQHPKIVASIRFPFVEFLAFP